MSKNYNIKHIPESEELIIPGAVRLPCHGQYAITENGDVYRVWGSVKRAGVPIKRSVRDGGYEYVTLIGKEPGGWGPNPQYVHRLVAIAFLGPAPAGKPWVNHKDGNKQNNHVSNLEWTSISESIKHAYDTGLKKKYTGADHWRTGKKASTDTKKIMSSKKTGENHPKFKGWWEVNGNRYTSGNEAMRKEKLSFTALKQLGMFYPVGDYRPIPASVEN